MKKQITRVPTFNEPSMSIQYVRHAEMIHETFFHFFNERCARKKGKIFKAASDLKDTLATKNYD